MIILRKTIFLSLFLAFVTIIYSVEAYNITYTMQNFITAPNANATAPSVFWDQSCTTKMLLYTTAGAGGTYTLTHSYYSPDLSLLTINQKTRDTNITCQLQNAETQDTITSLNDFYEATTKTEYTADTIDTWLNLTYECSPDSNDLFIYNNTKETDSYGNHPFGYGDSFSTCFAQSPSQCTNTLTGDLGSVIAYLENGYFTLCGSDLRQDAEGESRTTPSCGGISSDIDMNYYIMVPFNSMSSGSVNISVFERIGYIANSGLGGGTLQYQNQYYLWDTVTNTTQNLGTSFPFSQSFNLIPDREYFLFIGTRYFIDDQNCGSGVTWGVVHNFTSYDITIDACQTNFICGEWSECQQGLQTRTCIDNSDCNAPNRVEERSCFDLPTFDLTLGFEDTIITNNGVYICTKQFFTCFDVLSTINAEYPVNWTVFPDFDGSGVARNNFVKMSSDTASVGSRSLKMWYIPPKINEPVPSGSSTVCGNATTGSFPEVTHPYNESLFISQNVTFTNPFPQIRYDVRKCNEPVLQYDYTGDLLGFNCGKLCYASTCNITPKGRYGVRVSRLAGNTISVFPTFSMFNETDNVTSLVTDGNISTYAESTFEPGFIVNSSINIFQNGTRINFLFNLSDSVTKNLCVYEIGTANQIGFVPINQANQIITFNITLENITSPINGINLSSCFGANDLVLMYEFNVENFVNLTTSDIVFDYIGFAPDTWDEGQIIHDLSNINLQPGLNYTISLSINPENQFDPETHCAYMDNFRVTFTELALPECVSECIAGSIDRRIASLSNGVCTFITQINSPDCIGDQTERQEVENILLGLGGGDITDNSTCIDSDNDGISDDLYIFDSVLGRSELIIDSAACLLIINQTAEQDRTTTPLTSAEAWLDWILFLISPLFVFFFISLAISGAVGASVKAWEAFGITFAAMLFFGMLITIPGGTAPIIPIWVGIAMIAVISLLIAQRIKGFGFGIGGG